MYFYAHLNRKKLEKNLISDPPTFRKLSKHFAVKITKTKLPQQFLFEKKPKINFLQNSIKLILN